MKVVIERCAGLDVHKKTVVACVRTPRPRAKERLRETRTFATTMKGLEALRGWLGSHGVTDAAMESMGVYWRPVWAVLEDDFRLLLVNARHAKQVPGRKTDVRDCEWLAQLLECGLLKGSFVPSSEIRDLRDLTRLRQRGEETPPSAVPGVAPSQGPWSPKRRWTVRRVADPLPRPRRWIAACPPSLRPGHRLDPADRLSPR